MECPGRVLVGCKVVGGCLVLSEGVKVFVGKGGVVVIQTVSGLRLPCAYKTLSDVFRCAALLW